jgi:adenine-specific DNA-methyltransferase
MALKFSKITPKKALNKAFLKVRPLRSEMDLFKLNLITLLDKVKIEESEEHQKNNIRDFLLHTYYRATHEINTKGRQDLVIHTDKTTQSSVSVIIEAKKPSNKAEWITPDKINVKAVQELVLYYMRERVDAKNIDIKYLVATNIYEWYVFDAAYFDKVFYGNKAFVKQYEDWRDGKKVTKDTALFYNDIAKPFIDTIDEEFAVTYFDIRDYEQELRNEDKADDKKLIALQKLLSPYHLLRVSFANDSNELNNRFYKELLHIIGLEEVKDGGKQIIRRKLKDASEGSMIENTINILKTEDSLLKLRNKQAFGETKEEQLYNIALELNLTWINRILFLKLLEGQLLSYHKNDKRYNFLNSQVVFDYDEIYKLFHQVLAKTIQDRTGTIVQKYQWVPYLNSSLFEISDLETQTIKINSLDDHALLDVMNNSILTKYKHQSINPLVYLFEFLDAYDFASEGVEEVQEDTRTLINASILGKIFEKINGYKDGSIYTPGFITMYMCRQAIRRAVVQKFKDAYGWDIHEFDDIRNYIADRRSKTDVLAFNALINSLRLCDPAVGSGHFLVSVLNELVLIKYELGILCDDEGIRITDYDLIIENDELIVTYSNGDIFEYQIVNGKPKSKEDQRLQKTLFHEKQSIIENTLFGVDINPNSVKICRLRLWIELLKNAYYKESSSYTELETLPNIDINIKCGNSLISRFELDADLGSALKSIKYDIKTYRGFVQDYKNCKDREAKRGIEDIINAIKNDFRSEIGKKDKDVLKLNALNGELFNILNQQAMFETDKEKKDKQVRVKKLEADINGLSAKIEDIKSNAIYRDAFEWRFEFPEVLNDNGDFEGFDVVVGNPPYIRHEEIKIIKPQLEKVFKVYNSTADILTYFFELGHGILSKNGILTFIVSNKFFKVSFGNHVRSFLMKNTSVEKIIEFDKINIFNEATVKVAIVEFTKSKPSDEFIYVDINSYPNNLDQVIQENKTLYKQDLFDDQQWIFQSNDFNFITEKVSKYGVKLSEWDLNIYRGVLTGLNEAFLIDEEIRNKIIDSDPNSALHIKPVFRGREIDKYFSKPSDSYIIATLPSKKLDIATLPGIEHYLSKFGKSKLEQSGNKDSRKKTSNKWFETQDAIAFWEEFAKPKLIWKRIGSKLRFTYDESGFYALDSTCIATGDHLKYLVGVLNSKLIDFELNRFAPKTGTGDLIISVQALSPLQIPIPTKDQENNIEVLVDQIIELKKLDQDTTALEAEIDQLVYELYGLTEEEIKVVEEG